MTMGAGNMGVRQGAGGNAMGPYGTPYGRPGQAMFNTMQSGTGGMDPAYPGNSQFGLAGGNGQRDFGTPSAPYTGSLSAAGIGGGYQAGGMDPAQPRTGGLDPATGGLDPATQPALGRYQPPQGPYAPPRTDLGRPPQPPMDTAGAGLAGTQMGLLGGVSPEDQARQQQLGRMSPISYGFRG